MLVGGQAGDTFQGEPLVISAFKTGAVDTTSLVVFETAMTRSHEANSLMVLDARSLCSRCGRVGAHRCSLLIERTGRTREEKRMRVKDSIFKDVESKLVMNRRPKIGRTLFLKLRFPWIKHVTHRSCVCTLCFSANMMVTSLIEFADVFRRLSPVLSTLIYSIQARASGSNGVGRAPRMDDLVQSMCPCAVNEVWRCFVLRY